MSALALPTTVSDLIEEYNEKYLNIEGAIVDITKAHERLNMACTVQGTYVEPIASTPYLNASSLRKNLLKSGWRAVYNRLQIDSVASANDKKRFDQALAEFYGEVLPDVEPEDVKPSASTAVSKDLQFYWTPQAVVEMALDFADLHGSDCYRRGEMPVRRVLEPSCGDGRIMDELRARHCKALGIEYHPGRASEARAKGHAVVTTNFLEHPADPEFDAVVMNPPFYGRHYVKHVRHAYKFLKPGGTLVAILPATARYDHGEIEGEWRDLPVASFSEVGTNVPTTMLKMRKTA